MDKRSQIKAYFKPFPKGAVWLIILGIILALFIGNQIGVGLVGLLFLGLGIWMIVAASKKPSDAQVDAWIEEDLKVLDGKALTKMGTDQSELVGESVTVTGFAQDMGPAQFGVRRGKDSVIRFTPLGVTIINFTQNQLLIYKCALDLYTGHALNEGTDEYFYRDVVSVATKTEDRQISFAKAVGTLHAGLQHVRAAEMFVLTTSGGTYAEVVLRSPDLIKALGGGSIPITRAEKAIQTVRKMLREKKSVKV